MHADKDARDTILDSIADGVFTVDSDWRITSFNRAAERITGITRQEAIGQRCCDVFRASICETDCALRKTLGGGKPVVNKAIYIINPDGERIPISISTALLKDADGKVIGGVETFRDLSAIEDLRRELHKSYSFEDIVAKSKPMQELFTVLPTIAESDATVLIEGESGTGKELFARAIHNLSHRREGPMVTVNCGALPDTLLESELFGYKKGAFTGAVKDKPGRFTAADGGTIFLDEIADVSPALQVRLLRVLQDRAFDPLGGNETITADVRVIAAVNRPLEELVEAGSFRRDLYYRINVLQITLPPLRERREDIPLLIDHFLERLNRKSPKYVEGVSPEVLSILMAHGFPGNVRELENLLEHAFVLCQGSTIERRCLPPHFRQGESTDATSTHSVEDFERQLLLQILRRHDWSRTKAAAELGINKSTLWRKMRRLGINPPS